MSSLPERPVIGPTWVIGSVLVGTIVAVLILAGGELEFVAALGLSLVSILLAIGFAAEKIVVSLDRAERSLGGPGSPEPPA